MTWYTCNNASSQDARARAHAHTHTWSHYDSADLVRLPKKASEAEVVFIDTSSAAASPRTNFKPDASLH